MEQPMDIYQRVTSIETKAIHLENELNKQVLGQNHLYQTITSYIKRGEAGLTSPGLPRGSFVSLGPTGVGKTETVKVIALEFFKNEDAIVRVNMSEYKTLSDIKQFVGTPESKGFLQKLLEKSGTQGKILLLDEIEKAHSEIFDLLLQILDEASLTFHNGDTFDFTDWYIWATSNIGARIATKGDNPSPATMQKALEAEFRKEMRPELVERFNCILTYMRLTTDNQLKIAHLLITKEIKRLNKLCKTDFQPKKMDALVTFMRKKGYSKALGARRMRKTVQESLQSAFYKAISDKLESGLSISDFSKVNIVKDDEKKAPCLLSVYG